jgi:transposase
MHGPYPGELRTRVIDFVEEGGSRREAAEQFDVSVSSAIRWVQRFRENGTFEPMPSGGSTSPLEKHSRQILALISEVSDLTLEAIAKRRSIEKSISQLHSYQEEMEQCVSLIEQNSDGEPLERRLQKLAQFVGAANTRCEDIERAMPTLLQLEERFEALQRRLWPLEQKEAGVNGVLNALFDAQNRLTASLARLEQDDGVSLGDRIQQLAKTKHELEERVSSVLAQFSEIETIHKDINGLFLRLNQAHRIPRELDAAGRVVPFNG